MKDESIVLSCKFYNMLPLCLVEADLRESCLLVAAFQSVFSVFSVTRDMNLINVFYFIFDPKPFKGPFFTPGLFLQQEVESGLTL